MDLSDDVALKVFQIGKLKTDDRRSFKSEEQLANTWTVPILVAKDTLKATTQEFIHSSLHPIERRFRTKNAMLHYNRLSCQIYSDTFFANCTSLIGNKCAQLFVTDFGYLMFTAMKNKSEAVYALQELIRGIRIPPRIHTDGAKELTSGKWREVCRDTRIVMSQTEKDSPWQNRTEIEIRELKHHVRHLMGRARSPAILWDFCCFYAVDLRNHLARPLPQLNGRTPIEKITGNTPDVSEYLEFKWFDLIWYYEPEAFPCERKHLARWIGVAHRIGQAMCYWLLPSFGIPIARTTIQLITLEELETDKVQLKVYNDKLSEKLGALSTEGATLHLYREDEDDDSDNNVPFEPEAMTPEIEDIKVDVYDELLLTEPILEKGGTLVRAKITGRKRDQDGNLVGKYNSNPLLNTRVYIASFPDGHIAEYSANVIADSIYQDINNDGLEELFFDSIIGHERDETHKGDPIAKYVTKGWNICVSWKDGSTSWHPLSEIKNLYPVQLAEYAKMNKLEHETAFSWWIKPTLRHRHTFMKSTRKLYLKRSHKFGIRLPKTVEEALEIDKQTKTTFWRDAIHKEMKNNRLAFKVLEEEERVPMGYKWIKCHMIFDIKMDFTRKARYVAGGHMTDPPSSITYSSVVSRNSVRIAFLLAALNDIDILAYEIGNAYLNATPREKVYTTAGPEFGAELQGRNILIVRALYGLKSSGAAWRSHLANTLHHMGFTSSRADPDVWYRAAIKVDGMENYEYVLVYVDDLLVLSHQPDKIMKALEDFYRLKDGFAKPDRYLEAQVKEWRFPQRYCGHYHLINM